LLAKRWNFGKAYANSNFSKDFKMAEVVIIGAGYVGLVTAACFADAGIEVVAIERNSKKLDSLQQGKSPFFEPGLDPLIGRGITAGKLKFVASLDQALISQPKFIFICVGTPSLPNGGVDDTAVLGVAKELGVALRHDCLVINKSTVPVGMAKKVKKIIAYHLAQREVSIAVTVVSNPEFLRQGSAVADTKYPDRIVVGTDSSAAAQDLKALYAPFITKEDQFLVMRPASAEIAKYAANTMLAMRISFMNQMAQLAEATDADITEIKRGMAKDRRIGEQFLNAGIGYGGSCFPKDVKGLVAIGQEFDVPMTLAERVDDINTQQRSWFMKKILDFYGAHLADKTIAIWGLSFKPDTDDIRSAPSVDVITALKAAGAKVAVYDPVAMENIKGIFGDQITYAASAQDLLQSDALVVLTEWPEFVQVDPTVFLSLKDKMVFDARNVFDPTLMHFFGVNYMGIGRTKDRSI
jgi:UDPglucose 6-dehydrogenase